MIQQLIITTVYYTVEPLTLLKEETPIIKDTIVPVPIECLV